MTELAATAGSFDTVAKADDAGLRADGSDDPAMIAANVALIAELSQDSRTRRAYRRAADKLIAGCDVEDVAHSVPKRLGHCLRAGRDAGCLGALLEQERVLAENRSKRQRAAHAMLSYHGLMLVLVTAFAIAITAFGWNFVRPVEQSVADALDWDWRPSEKKADVFYWYLVFQTTFVGVCAVLLVATTIWAVVRTLWPGSRAPMWTYFLWNGHRIRAAAAREELLRFLAVFVTAKRPLPEAFAAMRNMAHSSLARRVAKRCECRAIAGDDPLPEFPRVHSATVGHDFNVHMTADSLHEEAAFVALGLESDIDSGLVITRFAMIAVIACLLLLGFLTVTIPGLLHIGGFSFGGGMRLF